MTDTIADKKVGAEAAALSPCCDEVLAGLFVLELTLAATDAAEHQRGHADTETLMRGHDALGGVLKKVWGGCSIFRGYLTRSLL